MVGLELVVLAIQDGQLRVLLGPQGLPGRALRGASLGGVGPLDRAARALLRAEVAADQFYLEQLYTFAFPRASARRIVVAYLALVRNARLRRPGRAWLATGRLPRLSAEQRRVLEYGLERLHNKITYTNLAFAFLPRRFTFTDLQRTYEVVLGRALDKRNFRKKILSLQVLAPDGQVRRGGGRPARLYQFTGPREVTTWPALGGHL